MQPSESESSISRAEIERIQGLGEEDLDGLPFGAIRLDKNGTVLSYNQTEAELSGRKKESVLGKNFFTDVAPCTNVQDFAGHGRSALEHLLQALKAPVSGRRRSARRRAAP